MNWRKHALLLSLLLAIALSHIVAGQEGESEEPAEPPQSLDEAGEEPAPPEAPETPEEPAPPEEPAAEAPANSGVGQTLGQSLLQPGLGQAFGQGPIGWMFPALSTLLSFGSIFPGAGLLGAPPDEPAAAASKVVLVLAEDRDPQAAASAPNEELSRNTRQSDMVSQMMQTLTQGFGQFDFSQLSQSTGQATQQLLQQALPQDLTQNAGQLLSQALQQTGQVDPGQFLSQAFQQTGQMDPGQFLSQAFQQTGQMDPGQFLSQALQQTGQIDPGQLLSQAFQQTGQMDPGQFLSQALQQTGQIDPGQLLSQALQQTGQIDPGQFLSQALQQTGQTEQSQNGGQLMQQLLQQMVPQDLSQNAGQMLSQTLQQIPQMLGQPAPDNSGADSIVGDAPAAPRRFNIQSAIDSGSAMLGQALGQGNPSGGGGGLFNFRGFQPLQQAPPPADNPEEGAASQISEVRVKPDAAFQVSSQRQHMSSPHMSSQNPPQASPQSSFAPQHTYSASKQNTELKLKAALREALGKKTIPILWFRVPSQPQSYNYRTDASHPVSAVKSAEDLQIESKLQAFERQVIAELEQLQEIERQAKEMRAAAKGMSAKTFKDSPYKLNYPLSKTPIHKITREDIEKALNDEYVKKLLQKSIHRNAKGAGKSSFSSTITAPIKRQTMTNDPTSAVKKISMEDIIKMMAYAYRMSNATGPQMLEMDTPKKNDGTVPWTLEQVSKSTQRQWMDGNSQSFAEEKAGQQMHTMMPTETQWIEQQNQRQQSPMQQRQWLEGQKMQHTSDQQQPQISEMRHWIEEQEMEQRQWAEEKMKERQFADDQMKAMKQRQWAEQQNFPQVPVQQQTVQQTPMRRQWADDEMKEQRQWAEQQITMPTMARNQPATGQRQSMEMPTQMQTHEPMPEQREWAEPPPTPLPRLVGEATPQMPENDGKARLKGGNIFDELDLFGLGGGSKKGKGKKGGSVHPTIINYYYTQGGSRYPAYGGYSSANYGGSSYGGGGAYGGGGYGSGGGYGGGGGYGSSGGYGAANSYGGSGGYGGGAYRTAVGNDEIDAMLREHSAQTKIIPETTIAQPTTPPQMLAIQPKPPNNIHANPDHIPAQTIAATFIEDQYKQSPPSTSTSSSSTASSVVEPGSTARLDNKLRFNGIAGVSKCSENGARQKRNANFGSLQPIDEKSLNELRDTYKENLKEITLRPDEDPAEALMRYNEASIRDALERANQEPLEISGGEAAEEVHAPDSCYKDAHLHGNSHGYNEDFEAVVDEYGNYLGGNSHASTLHHHSHHHHHQPQKEILSNKKLDNRVAKSSMIYRAPIPQHSDFMTQNHVHGHPHQYQHQQQQQRQDVYIHSPASNADFGKSAQYPRKDHYESVKPLPFAPVIKSAKSSPSATVPPAVSAKSTLDDKGTRFSTEIAEPDMAVVLKVIKERLSNCCEKCKDRILSGIKEVITSKEDGEPEPRKAHKNNHESKTKKASSIDMATAKTEHISDEEHEQWLNEMASRGYERKYLTKAHQWEYLHSGKLSLTSQSEENTGSHNSEDSLADQTNEQSYKRDTPRPSRTAPTKFGTRNKQRAHRPPATANISGKAFGVQSNEGGYLKKEHAHAVNAELHGSKEYSDETTLSPYALRGKFRRGNSGTSATNTAVAQPVKFDRLAEQPPQQRYTTSGNGISQHLIHAIVESQEKAAVDENAAKVVQLLNLLYDLKPVTANPSGKSSRHVLPIASTTTEKSAVRSSTVRQRSKRLRSRQRRPKSESTSTPQTDHNGSEKRARSSN